jgi:tRNA(Ile)-lysidine synthase
MGAVDGAGYRLERHVAGFVAEERVLRHGERLLLMLSGGADSMALLALLPLVDQRLCLGLKLEALHVDYAARGADSDRDREIVVEACRAAAVPLEVVRLRHKLQGGDFQARARDLRYGRAREIAAAHGCNAIVTAHNRNDQAETILYRLAKYATPRGLVGMRPREEQVARPLLCLDSSEIREYCRRRGLRYGEDVTNAQAVYARNVLRLEVIPLLERLNPRLAETLAGTSAMAAAEAEVLAAATAAAAARAALPTAAADLAAFSVRALTAERPALRALVLHDAVRRAFGGEALVARRLVQALLALVARTDEAGRVDLGRGLEGVRADGALRLRRRTPAHGCRPVVVEGRALAAAGGEGVPLAFCDHEYRSVLVAGAAFDKAAAAEGHAFAGLTATPQRVTLRHARRGERFAPLGLGRETTVARFLAGARAPATERARAVVLDIDGAVAWVGHRRGSGAGSRCGRVAQGFRVDESTACTLQVFVEDS